MLQVPAAIPSSSTLPLRRLNADVPPTQSRKRPAAETESLYPGSSLLPSSSSRSLAAQSTSPSFEGEGNWITTAPRQHYDSIHPKQKRKVTDYSASEQDLEDAVEHIAAETIERHLPLLSRRGNVNPCVGGRSLAISGRSRDGDRENVDRGGCDVRPFKKNFVSIAREDELLRAADMVRVLPKESEREVQLRVEAEESAIKERQAEELFTFADRFGAKGKNRGR